MVPVSKRLLQDQIESSLAGRIGAALTLAPHTERAVTPNWNRANRFVVIRWAAGGGHYGDRWRAVQCARHLRSCFCLAGDSARTSVRLD